MSDHIPQDVMVNILMRLCVKDLVSCRRVSKQWLSIIDDPHFISRQLQCSISTNSNAALFVQDRVSPTLYWKQNNTSNVNFFSTSINYEPARVLLMGSCHGLVCLTLFDHPDDFVVFNPSTGERHTVSCPMVERREGERLVAYGFGYDKSSDDYKMVRILQTNAEIYGVRSNSFSRRISLPTAFKMHYSLKCIGVFVGGSIHWCIDTNSLVIHAIDLVSNTYHQLQFPDYNFGETGFATFNVGIADTRLSLCGVSKERPKICIWVMEEYGNPESWNMLYYIDYYWCFPYSVTTLGSNGDKIKLLIDWQKFAWCDPSKNKDETISINYTKWPNGYYEAEYCLESLVKIFPNQTADVKKDDADEKQLKKLADQEITEDELPAFLNLHNLKSLVYESDLEQYWHEGCYFSRVQSI
ncbi:F-box protein CPR1 [Linum perenne]